MPKSLKITLALYVCLVFFSLLPLIAFANALPANFDEHIALEKSAESFSNDIDPIADQEGLEDMESVPLASTPCRARASGDDSI